MTKVGQILTRCIVFLVVVGWGFRWYKHTQAQKKEIDTTKTTIVMQLSAVSMLETATMHMQKIIAWKQWLDDLFPGSTRDNALQNFLFEDSIQIDAHALITAWFDLTHLGKDAIQIASSTAQTTGSRYISIVLPNPQIIHASLTKETAPFIRKRGILSAGDMTLETDMRNKTIDVMTQEAIDNGILDEAKKNAQKAIEKILVPLGYTIEHITYETKNTDTTSDSE